MDFEECYSSYWSRKSNIWNNCFYRLKNLSLRENLRGSPYIYVPPLVTNGEDYYFQWGCIFLQCITMFSKTKLIPLTILFYFVFLQITLFISAWAMVSEFALPQRTCCNVYSTTKKILGIKANDIDMIVLVGEFCFIVMYYSLHSGTVIIKITIKDGVRR